MKAIFLKEILELRKWFILFLPFVTLSLVGILVFGTSEHSVVNKEFLETVWHEELGLFCRSVSDGRHQKLSLESPSHSVVNTLGLSPVLLQNQENNIIFMYG